MIMIKLDDIAKKMDASVGALGQELAGLRTGRASTHLLDHITVEAYGSRMPLNQVANVNVPESRLLTVQVWDKSMVKAVEKAIANAGLGLNPVADGQTVRVPIPELTEERRKELSKVAGKYAENGKVAVRNARRDAMDELKKLEKDKHISEDESHKLADDVQKLTDERIKKIDEMLALKEKDIMQV
jgi:ribosome recycling factor